MLLSRFPVAQRMLYRTLWSMVFAVLVPLTRAWAPGFLGYPRRGAYLVLGNHVNALDPFWLSLFCMRRIHFMASANLFRMPVVGTILRAIGAFPKAKYTRDKASMETLAAFIADEEPVALFPEGQRCWDGRTEPIHMGTARLIRRLKVPVVFVRLLTAYHQRPRWADYPRSVPVRIEYSEPVTFPETASDEEILADVRRRLYVDADHHPPGSFSFGFRLAWGLPDFLWACPACFQVEGLRVEGGDVVACQACKRAWRLDVGQRLHPHRGGAEHLTVATAHDTIKAHFGASPVVDAGVFEQTGVVLAGEDCGVAMVEADNARTVIARGRGRLTAETLSVEGGNGAWSVRIADIIAVSLEASSRLQIRTGEGLFDFFPKGESRYKWGYVIRCYKELVVPSVR